MHAWDLLSGVIGFVVGIAFLSMLIVFLEAWHSVKQSYRARQLASNHYLRPPWTMPSAPKVKVPDGPK